MVGFEGIYEVSNKGGIRSLTRPVTRVRLGVPYTVIVPGRDLAPGTHRDGYKMVDLSRDGVRSAKLVHCLILEAFVGAKPAGMISRHRDGNPAHNCWPENLVYGTPSDNMRDKIKHGTDHNVNKTHCPQGHEYTDENTRVWQGRRHCKECGRAAVRRYRVKANTCPTP